MRMQMMQQQQQHQQQQQQGMTRPPPPDYKTPMMAAGIATPGAAVPNQPNVMMGQHMGMMAGNQQQGGYPPAIRPGIRPMVPAQSVAVGRPSPNGATSPMLQNQQQVQQQRPMMNYPQQQQQQVQQQQQQQPQGMMGKITGLPTNR